MRLRIILIIGLMAAVATAACGGGAKTVAMTEFKFDPDQITVKKGEKVELNLQNKGSTVHNFALPDLDVRSPEVEPGQSAKIEFTPDRTGTFQFLCTEPGHAQSGMVGKLTVQ